MPKASRQFAISRFLPAVLVLALCGAASAAKLPAVDPPPGKVLLVAQPHHDDHTTDYGLAGLITRFIDDGYKAYYVRGSNDEKDGSHGYARNDMINLKETYDAIRILGMEDHVTSLNWRNNYETAYPLNQLREQLIFLVRKYKPDTVVGHNGWEHYQKNPGHRNLGWLYEEAFWMAGYRNVHPEHFEMGVEPHEVYHHFGKARLDWGLGHRPNVIIEMNEAQVRLKEKAIHAHQNVYANPGGARAMKARLASEGLYLPEFENINDDTAAGNMMLEWHMNWISRRWGKEADVKYGEDYYYMDEFYHLPGLKKFLGENAEKK
ncbi:MAG: PIG-L family deacetylase [Acidobacteria bacterium]|nr:PIG-L family deacetylase [Acidobacteriota bacterium]